jgi:septum site-determining protein MinC
MDNRISNDGQEEPLAEETIRTLATSVFQGAARESKKRQRDSSRDETLLIKRNLRSGQTVRSKGNVVILGDVNPGAEVVARGDVLVFGRLRGMVHAGAKGDSAAIVAASHLEPTQLRISRHITRPPEEQEKTAEGSYRGPEVASIRGDTVVIDSYLTYDERRKPGEVIHHE